MVEEESGQRYSSLFAINKHSIQKSITNLSTCIRRVSSELCVSRVDEVVELKPLIEAVKKRCALEFADHKDKYDENDIRLLLECPEYRYIERYLERQKYNVEEAFKMIKETLRWRKEEKLSTLTDHSFPLLCYKCGFQYIFGADIDGNVVLHVRFKLYVKYHPNLVDLMEKFFCFLAFKADQMGAKRNTGWVVFADLTGVSVKQWDLQHFVWLVRIFTNYCPSGLRKVIIYNVAWYLQPILNTAIKVMPQYIKSIVHVVSRGEQFKFIPKENLVAYLDGESPLDHRTPPSTAGHLPSELEVMRERYNMSSVEVYKMMKKYEKIVKETA